MVCRSPTLCLVGDTFRWCNICDLKHHHHQHQRPPGPSRLRRRARRAHARDQAAAEAARNSNKPSEAALKANTPSPPTKSDAAVQAVALVNPSPATADVAVQAAAVTPHTPAAQADPQPGRSDRQLQALLSQLQGDQHVMDTFCADREFFELGRKQKEEERKKEHQEDLEKIKRMMENF